MSFKRNRSDFEVALADMKETLELMESCINEVILGTLKSVIEEYECHYVRNIDELISERDKLRTMIDDAEI